VSAAGWDVVVVGGGPAGAACAARLAADGWRVLMLERAAFPRRKPCGECLNPAAVDGLRRLGTLDAVEALPHARLRGWRITAPDGRAFDGAFPADAYGIAVPRDALDDVLLRHAVLAGAEVRTGWRVVDLVFADGRVVGVVAEAPDGTRTPLPARLVVGADGLRSVVVRRLRLLRRTPRLRKLALTAHLRGVPPAEGRGELRVGEDGCVGVADVGAGMANVTVVLHGAAASRARGGAEACFDAAVARHLPGAARTDDVLATGPFDWPVRRAVADGALLVGDAAGYYDPFTGQGMFRALRGAEFAAACAHDALCAGDLSARMLAPYERARRGAFAPGERLQHAIEAVTSRPRLLGAAAGFLARRPAAADALVAAAGDLRPVRTLLHPALLKRRVA
jgi:menaquinone-9 beta-reductase